MQDPRGSSYAETPEARPGIDSVRAFWDANPLWTGESRHEPGSRAFFDEHRETVIADCFAGRMDERIFPQSREDQRVLDLGCGIGFWLIEFWRRGFAHVTGADLSPASLELAAERCRVLGAEIPLFEENAEALSFADESFTHVNCQGVVHHTPNPEYAMAEIHRVLRPGGTASISVYYKNVVLRNHRVVRPVLSCLQHLGVRLKGRDREDMLGCGDADDIIRTYDGQDNPIGLGYTRDAFRDLVHPFHVEEVYFHFFPARAIPFQIPVCLHRILDRRLPFMIYANLRKV